MIPALAISNLYFLAWKQCKLGVTREQKVAILRAPRIENAVDLYVLSAASHGIGASVRRRLFGSPRSLDADRFLSPHSVYVLSSRFDSFSRRQSLPVAMCF
jgi:hypothetical protein